jgi:hypothetical protein
MYLVLSVKISGNPWAIIFVLFFYIQPGVALFPDPFHDLQLRQHVHGYSCGPFADAGAFGQNGAGELFFFLK